MENTILTEAELREALRKRRPVFPDITMEETVTLLEVDTEFRSTRRKRADLGFLNHMNNLLFEPRNPFEPQRMRKPKLEATVFGTLLGLVGIAVLAFNLAAPRR